MTNKNLSTVLGSIKYMNSDLVKEMPVSRLIKRNPNYSSIVKLGHALGTLESKKIS